MEDQCFQYSVEEFDAESLILYDPEFSVEADGEGGFTPDQHLEGNCIEFDVNSLIEYDPEESVSDLVVCDPELVEAESVSHNLQAPTPVNNFDILADNLDDDPAIDTDEIVYEGRPRPGRKRKVPTQSRSDRKRLYNTNKWHVNSKGNVYQEKIFDERFECLCKENCTGRVNLDSRRRLFSQFWTSASFPARCAYLNTCVRVVKQDEGEEDEWQDDEEQEDEGQGDEEQEEAVESGQQKSMNPQVMIDRQQHFHKLLIDLVKVEHNKFLQNLNPPMNIHPHQVTRWHPEFDLQTCPDVAQKQLPQPPNVEKFSSAKDILSTARNLFDCATPKERMMQRYEAKQQLEKQPELVEPKSYDPVASVLKGVPKSLIERIRARQAAKALDSMTRRPSQDKESNNYARLPDLARYVRNIFVTESKGVLDLDFVLTKLENSYRERVTRNDMKDLLQLLAKETPTNWLTFPHLRDRDFLKINKSADLTEIIKQLEAKAEEKR